MTLTVHESEELFHLFHITYCTVIFQYSFLLHVFSDILWSSCFESTGYMTLCESVKKYILQDLFDFVGEFCKQKQWLKCEFAPLQFPNINGFKNMTACILSYVQKMVITMRGVVLNRVCILEFFCSKQGLVFKLTISAWNLGFPVFISRIVCVKVCNKNRYISKSYTKTKNTIYWPRGAAVVSTVTSLKNAEKLLLCMPW